MPARRRRQTGTGFFSSIGNAIGKVNNLLKSTKAISSLGSLIPLPGAQKVAGVAGALGYGRRRRRRRPRKQRGAGPLSSVLGMFGLGKRKTTRVRF